MISQKLVAVTEHVEEAGLIVWWRLEGNINFEKLAQVWQISALDADLLPTVPSKETSFHRALLEFQEKRMRVFPTELGWALVSEHSEKRDINFKTELKLFFEDGETKFEPPHHPLAVKIIEAAIFSQMHLSAKDCSGWMISLLKTVDAVPLRDGGGVYFVPRKNLERWNTMVEAIRSVSNHTIHEVRALNSHEAVAAISDSITREAEQQLEVLRNELLEAKQDTPMGLRKIEARQEKLRMLDSKLKTYEAILGTRLVNMRENMEQVAGALAIGYLVA